MPIDNKHFLKYRDNRKRPFDWRMFFIVFFSIGVVYFLYSFFINEDIDDSDIPTVIYKTVPKYIYKSDDIENVVNHSEAYRACVKPKEQVCDGDFKYWERKYRHDPQKALEIRSNCYYEASLKCEGR